MTTFSFNGHSYELVGTALNWRDAKSYAADRDGYLAIVNSKVENDASFAQVPHSLLSAPSAEYGGGSAYVQLGASDADVESSWIWVNGTAVSTAYSNWGSGSNGSEPDDHDGQDAMAMGLEVEELCRK